MKSIHRSATVALAALALIASAQAADVAISLNIGQPGFYGRLDMDDYTPPQLVYQQPRMARAVPANRQPIYLNVPPGHAKNWRRHCHTYNACDERVYFVRNSWYEREYVARHQRRQNDQRNHPQGPDRDRDRDRDHDRNPHR